MCYLLQFCDLLNLTKASDSGAITLPSCPKFFRSPNLSLSISLSAQPPTGRMRNALLAAAKLRYCFPH